MGSLTSRPSVPSPQPQIVYVPQPVAQPTPAPSRASEDPGDSLSSREPVAEETASEVRQQSLLGRERSRFGTIQTSFRGLLSQSDATPQRKTLLGE